jgi:hypothetical protein
LPQSTFVRETTASTMQSRSTRPKPLTLTPVMESQAPGDADIDYALSSPTTGLLDLGSPGVTVPLQGLGIDSYRSATGAHVAEDADHDFVSKPPSLRIPAIRREPGSPMSKSSSQESIILSIASSIMGTHRSSNSSTSLSDFSHLANIDDEMFRPSDVTHRGADNAEGNTSDSSQDTVTTEPKSGHAPSMEFPSSSESKTTWGIQQRGRGISLSLVNVPNRSSSIAALHSPIAGTRQRSSTFNGGRQKGTRTSYSLFPPAPPTPAILEH